MNYFKKIQIYTCKIPNLMLIYSSSLFRRILHNQISGCGAAGSALDWGSRGREFKSRHSDQKRQFSVRKLSFFDTFLFFLKRKFRHGDKIGERIKGKR